MVVHVIDQKYCCTGTQRLLELIVDLLLKDQQVVVHVIDPYEVGPLEVVLDEANHPAAPLVPPVAVARALAVIHLGNKQNKYPCT